MTIFVFELIIHSRVYTGIYPFLTPVIYKREWQAFLWGNVLCQSALNQLLYPFIEVTAPGAKFIYANLLGDILTGSRLVVVVMLFMVTFYRLDNAFARSRFRTVVYQLGVTGLLQVFF